MSNTLPTVVFLSGPTASGKTRLAVELFQYLDCGLISVDSAMVYRGLDIGTAKPDRALLARVPHRLIDICEPTEAYSAARFCDDARSAVGEILAQGKTPVLVGGTGMYFRALEQGLSALPAANPALRRRFMAEAAAQGGWPALHDRLSRLDSESARHIHRHDAQRIQRALEVWTLCRQPLSALLKQNTSTSPPWRIVKFILAPADRSELHRRIAKRFQDMMARGFLDEVRALYACNTRPRGTLPALRLVGYRQALPYLAGVISLQTLQERVLAATRQLAKRQMTWWRGDPKGHWLDPKSSGNLRAILARIE